MAERTIRRAREQLRSAARLALAPSMGFLLAMGFAAPTLGAAPASLPDLKTFAEEACTAVPAKDGAAAGAILSLRCADTDSGQILRFTALGAQAQLAAAFAAHQAAVTAQASLACRPAVPLQLQQWTGPDLLAMACRSGADGWPHIIVGAVRDKQLYMAHGPAGAAPALVALVGGVAPPQTINAQVQALWDGPVALGNVADQAQIRRLWTHGRFAAARFEYGTAERLFSQAREMQVRLVGEGSPGSIAILMDLALATALGGRAEEAEALLAKAAGVIAQSPRPADRARLANYQGQLAALRGDFDLAANEAGSAVAQWRQLVDTKSAASLSGETLADRTLASAELAMSLNLEASVMLRGGDAASAAVRASEALVAIGLAQAAPMWWRADILATLGEATARLGRLAAAEKYLQTALRIRTSVFGEGAGTLRLWMAQGRSYQADGMSTNAIIAYRKAVALAAALPRESTPLSDEDLIPFVQTIHDLQLTITEARDRQGLLAEAFAAFQLSRSPDLERTNALVMAQVVQQTPGLPPLLEKVDEATSVQSELRAAVALEQGGQPDTASASRVRGLQASLAVSEQSLAALRGDLGKQFPQFRTLMQQGIYSLDAVRARLTADEALAMFLVGRDQSFLLLVRRDGLTLSPVAAGRAALADSVRRLRRGLEIEGRSVSEFDLAAAHDLYTEIFGEAQSALRNIKRLAIVPAGPLSGLPFGVLIEAPGQPGKYRDARWLAASKAISYAPTLASFMSLRSTRPARQAPKLMLAVANPVLTGSPNNAASLTRAFAACRTAEPADPALLRNLMPLPETEREVKAVAAAIGAADAVVLAGADASEPSLRGQSLDDYRILYFATHGLIPGDLQCQNEPGLVLTPPAQSVTTRREDGLLDASEIANLNLRADLVVLSACNTAAPGGTRLGSGSLSGLAEAFFRAGARSVIASHWQVPSAATEQLMRQTFAQLGQARELPVDEALQHAQQAAIRDQRTAHPFFWAAFVVIGDGKVAPLSKEVMP